MPARKNRDIAGSFAMHRLKSDVWHLASVDRTGPEIYLIGADSGADRIMGGTNISAVALEWRGHGVLVTLSSTDRPTSLHARAALVHEPFAPLYQSLPLARFDNSARRFWRRVFRLVRIPGGRHLLRFMAGRRKF